ncbi:helix-turn-helix transcriptional regulator [Catenuloplanes sp. NPDC051500]|uniref:helix-turn-helix transcriptional regulator n=1 Tax=Catenuloplanes sp. NPDC051500 TaxID=3363959 RepID=UPI003788C08B
MDTAFGIALKTWRDRLAPADAGLPAGFGRRASGLRREELAQLAGLSVDYVVRLEQGRARRPSGQVVAALALALQLDPVERDHLFRCAGLLPPSANTVGMHIPPGVQRMVGRLGDLPIAVWSADWTLLSWTPLYAALVGDPAELPAGQRNLLRRVYTPDPAYLAFHATTDLPAGVLAATLITDLRTAAAAYPADRRLTAMIHSLRRDSDEFARLWDSGAAARHESHHTTIRHPVVGDVTLDCDVLTANGADLRLVVYTAAAGSEDAGRLDLLRVTGAVSLTSSA